MAFNEKDNKVLAERVVVEEDQTRLTVSINKYKKGEPKVQISREVQSGGDWKFAKPGRFTFEEWDAITEGVERCRRKMKKAKESK